MRRVFEPFLGRTLSSPASVATLQIPIDGPSPSSSFFIVIAEGRRIKSSQSDCLRVDRHEPNRNRHIGIVVLLLDHSRTQLQRSLLINDDNKNNKLGLLLAKVAKSEVFETFIPASTLNGYFLLRLALAALLSLLVVREIKYFCSPVVVCGADGKCLLTQFHFFEVSITRP